MAKRRPRAAETKAAELEPTKLEPAESDPAKPKLIGPQPTGPQPIGSTDEPFEPLVWCWDAQPLAPSSFGNVRAIPDEPGSFRVLRAWVDLTDHAKARTAARITAALGPDADVPPVVIGPPRRLYRPAEAALPPLFVDAGARVAYFPTAAARELSAKLLPDPQNVNGERPDWDRLRAELVAAGYPPHELTGLRPIELLNALERARQPPQQPIGPPEAYLTREGFTPDPSPTGPADSPQTKKRSGRPSKYPAKRKRELLALSEQFPDSHPREIADRYNAKHGTDVDSIYVRQAIKAAKQAHRRTREG